jgi:hypothetical protein
VVLLAAGGRPDVEDAIGLGYFGRHEPMSARRMRFASA